MLSAGLQQVPRYSSYSFFDRAINFRKEDNFTLLVSSHSHVLQCGNFFQISSDKNISSSILTFIPSMHDNNTTLKCVATNPNVETWSQETTWTLDVSCKFTKIQKSRVDLSFTRRKFFFSYTSSTFPAINFIYPRPNT